MKNKKGFTLVEIIVVLVILAILAAIAVPSVIGYVNEAKELAIFKRHILFIQLLKRKWLSIGQQMILVKMI